MNKIKINKNVFIPMPVAIVGTMVEGKANFMTAGWVTRANASPPMIAVGINKIHYTHEGIKENKSFSVCFPGTNLIEKTDYCGIVSGKKEDKSNIFEIFYGDVKNAPMITDCPLSLECSLVETVNLPTNSIFIGEIKGAYTEEVFMTEGKPDFTKMDLFLLTMPDNNYWAFGKQIGKAWSKGREYKGK